MMNLEKTISAMKYIAASPAQEYGGFDPQAVEAAKAAVCYLTILDAWNKEVSNMQNKGNTTLKKTEDWVSERCRTSRSDCECGMEL